MFVCFKFVCSYVRMFVFQHRTRKIDKLRKKENVFKLMIFLCSDIKDTVTYTLFGVKITFESPVK